MKVTDEMVRAALSCRPFMGRVYDDMPVFDMFHGIPSDDRNEAMRAALEAAISHAAGQEVVGALSRGVPEGMVLVPVEPTSEMETAHRMYGDTSDWWQTVITAAIAAQRKEGE